MLLPIHGLLVSHESSPQLISANNWKGEGVWINVGTVVDSVGSGSEKVSFSFDATA